MPIATIAREHQRLLEIAREYRQRDYTVILDPGDDLLPDLLATLQVDMLARNAVEHVIVEVRTQESLAAPPDLEALAQAILNLPSWRFELVVTNPKDRSIFPLKNVASLSQQEIVYRLREARQLSEQKHSAAAMLLGWSTIEALLRTIADEEAIPIAQNNPGHLTKSLFVYGILDKQQYEILTQGLQTHTAIFHGYKEQPWLARTLDQVLYVADQLTRR